MKKKEFIALDVCKVLCAYAVGSIHLLPFADVSWEFMFWFNQVFCRLAVPFFFLTAGFFLYDKIHDSSKVRRYIGRLVWLYGLYTLLHVELILRNYEEDGIVGNARISTFLKEFFVSGSYVQFWYLPALMLAVLLCYLLVGHFGINEKCLVIMALGLYGVGALVNVYGTLLGRVPELGIIIGKYTSVFGTTRNGLFLGFPYVVMGMMFRKHSERIKGTRNLYWGLFVLGLIVMTAEAYLVRSLTHQENFSMLFMNPVVVAVLFLALCFTKVSEEHLEMGKVMRSVSFLIYAWHMFVHSYFGPYVYYKVDSQWYYLIVMLGTTVLAGAIVYFSRYKAFRWLKYFY